MDGYVNPPGKFRGKDDEARRLKAAPNVKSKQFPESAGKAMSFCS